MNLRLLEPTNLVGRLKRLLTDDLPNRQSVVGGAESGVQWEYAVLVERLQQAIEANKLSRTELENQLGEAWDLAKSSFE